MSPRRALLLAAAALAACGRSAANDPAATATGSASAPAPGSASAPAPVIPATTRQLVTAIVPAWDSTTAELRRWTRDGDRWIAAGPAWQAVIGQGVAWGAGLHGVGAPAGQAGPVKREGDGRSPAGVFALRGAYGYAATPPAGTALPYTAVDPRWKCVDDPASRHYNQIVDAAAAPVDWTSAEDMRRPDALYTWVIEVAHNPAHTAGAGSCIFLHVWRGPTAPTVGCTAMPEPALAQLLAALDPAAQPAYVLLPRATYDALAPAWALPR